MAQAKTAPTARTDKISAYHRQFADAIIDQISKGVAPWQRPWNPGQRFMPENALSGTRYSGGNAVYLAVAAQQRGFTDNRWATFRQIKEAGGHVERGQSGEKILFFDRTNLSIKKDEKGRAVRDDKGRPVYQQHDKPRPVIRAYTVFNLEQTRGLDLPSHARNAAPEWTAHETAEALIDGSKVPIRHVPGNEAYYSPKADQIVLPERAQFSTPGAYYATALHELSHASGHKDRLDRETFHHATKGGFGSPGYAREELRAEISAMMTGERIGIGHLPRDGHGHGPAYVENWVKALKDDPREIHRAAGEADRISRYLIEPVRERVAEHGKAPASSPVPPERTRGTPSRAQPTAARAVPSPSR